MAITLQFRTKRLPTVEATAKMAPPEEVKTKTEKVKSFVVEMATAARDAVVGFVRDCYRHAEFIFVLSLASLGLNALLSEIPFYLTLPMWVEAAMVIPVASVLAISILVWLGTARAKHRAAV